MNNSKTFSYRKENKNSTNPHNGDVDSISNVNIFLLYAHKMKWAKGLESALGGPSPRKGRVNVARVVCGDTHTRKQVTYHLFTEA